MGVGKRYGNAKKLEMPMCPIGAKRVFHGGTVEVSVLGRVAVFLALIPRYRIDIVRMPVAKISACSMCVPNAGRHDAGNQHHGRQKQAEQISENASRHRGIIRKWIERLTWGI